ncbi:hypothetical protein GCM10023206_15320 [Acinetobacter puyangensis]|uniref:Uncharacterized protein n=1 Tax=Acinetobacter puyangensis TaxID=1096779 RepID=A0A240E959_9GAMM|nr:hypothetical protein [Acinetobacter puyangensis]SNX44749.1 hypothetical protein SAMN05421731_104107 [Acinetobacter puyangensis]
MKLVQAILISGLSALSISAFAAESQEITQDPATLSSQAEVEAGTQQPVIVTTQADGTQDPNAVAAQPQSEHPASQDAAIEDEQNKQAQE